MEEIIKQGQNTNLTKLNLNYDGHMDGEEGVENYLKIVEEKLALFQTFLLHSLNSQNNLKFHKAI